MDTVQAGADGDFPKASTPGLFNRHVKGQNPSNVTRGNLNLPKDLPESPVLIVLCFLCFLLFKFSSLASVRSWRQ